MIIFDMLKKKLNLAFILKAKFITRLLFSIFLLNNCFWAASSAASKSEGGENT